MARKRHTAEETAVAVRHVIEVNFDREELRTIAVAAPSVGILIAIISFRRRKEVALRGLSPYTKRRLLLGYPNTRNVLFGKEGCSDPSLRICRCGSICLPSSTLVANQRFCQVRGVRKN
jgi:hypothetical protein